jgi:dinuclear metal center YbgI/SA1388 family protein
MPSRTIADAVQALGTFIPFDKAASWDPVGLQFGDPGARAETTAVCHEVTEEVVAHLEAEPVDLLISYHPLLFEPTSRLVAGRSASGRAFRLIRSGIALAVVHTAFDVVDGGAATSLADVLGLVRVRGFGSLAGEESVKIVTFVPPEYAEAVTAAMAAAGAGRIGNYSSCSFRSAGVGTFVAGPGSSPVVGSPGGLNVESEMRVEMVAARSIVGGVLAGLAAAHPYEEPPFDVHAVEANSGFIGRVGSLPGAVPLEDLTNSVSATLGGVVRVAKAGSESVRTVAVIPGSGSSYIGEAAAVADVLVTGDVSHHRARAALDAGLSVIDPGHAATERPGVGRLYSAVAALGPCRDLSALDATPWEEPE